jgi:hypothetical protein
MRTRVGASDRGHVARDTRLGEPCRRELTSTILASYEQKSGLTLNIPQAARLFTLQPRTCQVVFEDLIRDGALARDSPLDQGLARRGRAPGCGIRDPGCGLVISD